MLKKGLTVEFYNGQNQFKVPFMMYEDFEAILNPIQGPSPDPSEPYTKEVNQHIPSGFCIYSISSLMAKLKIHWNSKEVRTV